MRTKDFLSRLDHDRIVGAIKEAEAISSGEIRIFIQRGELEGDPLVAAQKKFHQLRMDATKERNGILIFVLPRARKFAVIGDEGIHRNCGQQFWEELIDRMRVHFQDADFTGALVEAIEEAGKLLARYFPKAPGPENELPDDVLEG